MSPPYTPTWGPQPSPVLLLGVCILGHSFPSPCLLALGLRALHCVFYLEPGWRPVPCPCLLTPVPLDPRSPLLGLPGPALSPTFPSELVCFCPTGTPMPFSQLFQILYACIGSKSLLSPGSGVYMAGLIGHSRNRTTRVVGLPMWGSSGGAACPLQAAMSAVLPG